jgi:hypothetical protein
VTRLYGGDDAFWDQSFKMPDVNWLIAPFNSTRRPNFWTSWR